MSGHDVEVAYSSQSDGTNSIQATVQYIHAIGSLVRLELERNDTNAHIEAELSRERFDLLKLTEGETVYVKPRHLRVFLES